MSCLRKSCRAFSYIQSRSSYIRSLNRDITNEAIEVERRARALRVLDIISSQSGGASNRQNHFSFVQEFLQTDSRQFISPTISDDFDLSRSKNGVSGVLEEVLLEDSSSFVNGGMQQRDEWSFDAYSLSSAVRSCGSNRDFRTGSGFHCLAMKSGFVSDVYVGISLVVFYRDSGDVDNAHKVFEEMPKKNVVSWTAMISGFAQEWRVDICLKLYSKMRNSTSDPNDYTFTALLSACTASGALGQGRSVHCQTLQMGFKSYLHISNALISMYCKCGDVDNAHKVFEEMPEKNVVSWTTMISGFAQEWRVDICLKLYSKMRNSTSDPNDYTFTALLSACTGSGALGQGRSVHCQTLQMGFKSYLHISNTLISMYCKCGDLKDAFRIFDQFSNKDVVSWNSMIDGYAQHGLATQAIELFEVMMPKSGTKPDAITYLGVLSSCRHVGMVKEGKKFFNLMVEHGLKPELNHYSCLVDLLGRFGLLQEALALIEDMPMKPNSVIWGSLLFSCRVHGDVWTGIRAAEERLMLEPECAATHVQLANLYASVQYWKEAATVRKMMKDKGLKTNPGCSWIEINNNVFMFKAEDGSNCRIPEIVHVLHCLVDHMTFFLRFSHC